MNNNTNIHITEFGISIMADCLEYMPTIDDKSVDMVLADLPYGTTKCKWDIIIPFEPLWDQYKRITKQNAAIVLTANQPFTSKLVMSNLKMFKYEWIWDKHIPRNFVNAKYRPMSKHENVLIFCDGKTKYNPIMTKRDKPVTSKNYSKKASSNGVEYNDSRKRTYTHIHPNTIITDKWEVNSGKIHPTQKPISLFEYLIKTYTDECDTVLDNVAGSFTTAIACIRTNRRYICIEKDKEYFDIGTKRIEDEIKLRK